MAWKEHKTRSKNMAQTMMNPPSIPSHQAVFGYNEDEAGMLLRSEGPDKILTGENNNRVGPGDYDVNLTSKAKSVAKWQQGVAVEPRFAKIKKDKEGARPGPGHYQPQKDPMNPVYKNNRTSVFASKVTRESRGMKGKVLSTQPVKNQRYASIAKAASSHRIGPDILESDDDDETPGPGAHWNPNMSSFKKVEKPQRL